VKRIGVISDTHLREPVPELGPSLARALGQVDLVLHAGDLVNISVLDAIEAPEVLAVAGNMDDYVVSQSLPNKRLITVEDKRIGLIHGWGSPMGLAGRVMKEFEGVDAIVFGHSHRPTNTVKNGVLLFNPGSYGRGIMGSGTVGLLTVDGGITGEIIRL
jgi:putative phosphoesterase